MQAYRPDRVVRVLAALVSLAYFVMLAGGVVVLAGMPVAKLVGGDNAEWVIGVPVPVRAIGPDAAVQTRWGEARLQIEDVRGSVRLPIRMLPGWAFVALWTYMAVSAAVVVMFMHHLRRIFQRVRGGAPFDSENAVRLRWLGILALATALLLAASEFAATLTVRDGLISDRLVVPLSLSVNGWIVFFGLVLLALAEVFRRGAELEEEQSLTV